MKRKEFMEKLCWALAKFDMVGHPYSSAFPCVCGDNKLSNDDAEVCAVTAEKVLAAIVNLSKDIERHADGSTTTSDPDMYESEVWAPAPQLKQ